MCGIGGKFNFNGKKVEAAEMELIVSRLRHRGPDDQGVFCDENFGVAHTRLSIIDLSAAGHQPMPDASARYHIVFNGEIYNFQSLRTELEAGGEKFQSHTDTEVILLLYKKHGVDCLKYLRGMFAFAIWDRQDRKLFLARDRVGKKPLKYYLDQNCLIFASELKAILTQPEVKKEVDHEAIDEYLTYQYVPHPKTGFKNIYKLEPGHYMLIDSSGQITNKQYWDLDFKRKEDRTVAEWRQAITDKLTESVKLRLISDVPLGAHLSGGIDSSLIVAMMAGLSGKPVKTFSIGFAEADYNELPFAKLVAEKYHTDHHEFIVRPDAIEMLPKLAYQYEEPYADSSALPTWYLSELTRQHVTVALNGDGGDENFAGYNRYQAMKLFRTLGEIPFKKQFGKLNAGLYRASGIKKFSQAGRLLDSYASSPADFYLKLIDYFGQDDKAKIYTPEFAEKVKNSDWQNFLSKIYGQAPAADWLDKLLYTDIKSYLPDDLLVKVDIASMAHSLEVRSPFLDHEFLELTAKIPSSLKMRGHNKKYLLKQVAYGYLPKECIDRPKQGFSVPLEHWFRGSLFDFLNDNLLDQKFLDYGWFRKDGLIKLIQDHKSGKQNHTNQLWALLMLRMFLRQWFEQ